MSEGLDIASAKAELRRAIRAARRGIGEAERESAALAVMRKLMLLDRIVNAKLVLAYNPMKYELDITPAVRALQKRGVRVAYPLCIEEGGLRLFVPTHESAFRVGAYGIMEPDPGLCAEVSPDELDAIILPAIGFDPQCRRLGQGGGYYDRLLARTACFTAAVGFDCQLVERVPCEETDKTVDVVVTPGGILSV